MKKETYLVQFQHLTTKEWGPSGDCTGVYTSVNKAHAALRKASGFQRSNFRYRIIEAGTRKVVWEKTEAPAPTAPPVTARTSPVRPYHLVPPVSLDKVTDRFEAGAQKYGPEQWRAGLTDPAWLRNRADHAVAHLLNYIHGIDNGEDGPEDNLAAVGWGIAVLLEAERAGRTPFREAYERNKKEGA